MFIARFHLIHAAVVLFAALLVAGCGNDKSNGNGPTPLTIEDGWIYFESGDYQDAATTFWSVLESDTSLATECYSGLGWSYAFKGDLDSAAANFESALFRNGTHVDANAGLSAVLLASGDPPGAVDHAMTALQQDAGWSFEYYIGVDYHDLHLILAEAYFAQGEDFFPLAQAQANILRPDNGLDANDADTWNGHATYAAALLKEIESIEADVGAEMSL